MLKSSRAVVIFLGLMAFTPSTLVFAQEPEWEEQEDLGEEEDLPEDDEQEDLAEEEGQEDLAEEEEEQEQEGMAEEAADDEPEAAADEPEAAADEPEPTFEDALTEDLEPSAEDAPAAEPEPAAVEKDVVVPPPPGGDEPVAVAPTPNVPAAPTQSAPPVRRNPNANRNTDPVTAYVTWPAFNTDLGTGGLLLNWVKNNALVPLLPGQTAPPPVQCALSAPVPVSPATGHGLFRPVYCNVTDPRFQLQKDAMQEDKFLEGVAAYLNDTFVIPMDVRLGYTSCKQPNAFYDQGGRAIVMCYELIDSFYEALEKDGLEGEALDAAVQDAEFFALYHELGHALVHVLDLPVTGKEEDAVDQLATYMVADGSDADEKTALEGALAFYSLAEAKGTTGTSEYWDQHSMGEQRFYNIICWLYGDSAAKYEYLVKDGTLPKGRADQCAAEWQRIESSWTKLLAESLKPQ